MNYPVAGALLSLTVASVFWPPAYTGSVDTLEGGQNPKGWSFRVGVDNVIVMTINPTLSMR
jgi:hypothetical protein